MSTVPNPAQSATERLLDDTMRRWAAEHEIWLRQTKLRLAAVRALEAWGVTTPEDAARFPSGGGPLRVTQMCQSPSGGWTYFARVALLVLASWNVSVQGPVLMSMPLPKPTH